MRKFAILFLILCFTAPAFALSQSEKLEQLGVNVNINNPLLEVKPRTIEDDKAFCSRYLGNSHYWDESKNECLLKDPTAQFRPTPDMQYFRITGPGGTYSGIMY